MGSVRLALDSVAKRIAVAVFLAVALFSVLRTYDLTWDILTEDRGHNDGLNEYQQVHAPGNAIPLQQDVFDFYRDRLGRGTRYYMHVLQSGFGVVDLPTAVTTYAQFFLLPAVRVDDPEEADVVLSWQANPHELPLSYSKIEQAGVQPFYVAWVNRER